MKSLFFKIRNSTGVSANIVAVRFAISKRKNKFISDKLFYQIKELSLQSFLLEPTHL